MMAVPMMACMQTQDMSLSMGVCWVQGVIRKRLMPFRFEGQPPPDASAVSDPVSRAGAPPVLDVYDADASLVAVGQARVIEGDVGLGLVRLSSALTAIAEGEPLFLRTPRSGQTRNFSALGGGLRAFEGHTLVVHIRAHPAFCTCFPSAAIRFWQPDWWPAVFSEQVAMDEQ